MKLVFTNCAIFLNGRKLPARYNLKDIEILLPQLASVFAAQ